MDYKRAGVNIEVGEQLVEWLKATGKGGETENLRLLSQNVISGIGGFSAIMRMPFKEMKAPCLVSCTDGVGTKVKLAAQNPTPESLAAIGQDLVAMCVNDLICCGARPLFFLDYYATGVLDLPSAQHFLTGVRQACVQSECLLIGGETAEMPGVYRNRDFDCAGFALGVVDESKILGPQRVRVKDRLVGLASSGFHSNGYSLLRKLFAADLDDWISYLLKPTTLYARLLLQLVKQDLIEAAAHITGGGLDNLLRVIPDDLACVLHPWEWPPPFLEVQKRAQLSDTEMLKTLNCGVGMILVVSDQKSTRADAITELARREGIETFDLGYVTTADPSLPRWSFSSDRTPS